MYATGISLIAIVFWIMIWCLYRSALEGQENSIYLPYRDVAFFYGEYEHLCKLNDRDPRDRAMATTFRRAMKDVISNKKKDGFSIKLSGSKGHFDKCDICLNAENLLKKSTTWTTTEKDIILAYRRKHIAQQFAERIKLKQNISLTYNYDSKGQPMVALLFSDGMTAMKGLKICMKRDFYLRILMCKI